MSWGGRRVYPVVRFVLFGGLTQLTPSTQLEPVLTPGAPNASS